MEKIIERINSILGSWNPIEVPEDIASDEYRGYIPLILRSVENQQQLIDCIEDILINKMGLDYDSSDNNQLNEVKVVCDQILKAVNKYDIK